MSPSPPPKKNRLDGRDVADLIEYLALESGRKATLLPYEKQILQLGLFYLQAESRRGRGQRDVKRIQITWRIIQPIMRRIGMLDEFDRHMEAKRKIVFFVTDKFF